MVIPRPVAIALVLLLACPVAPPAVAGDLVPKGDVSAPLPTDTAVREGMVAIRNLVRTNHSLVTHRRMPPDHALRFAAQVKIEADRILASSRLQGETLEKLRVLLEEIVAGIGSVARPAGGETAVDGLARADAALERYGQTFDHSGWVPLQAIE